MAVDGFLDGAHGGDEGVGPGQGGEDGEDGGEEGGEVLVEEFERVGFRGVHACCVAGEGFDVRLREEGECLEGVDGEVEGGGEICASRG